MATDLIHNFANWIHRQAPQFRARGITVANVVSGSYEDNSAIYVDFDTETHAGRVTLWDTGLCDMEILRIADELQKVWEHFEFEDWHAMEEKLSGYLDTLADSKSA